MWESTVGGLNGGYVWAVEQINDIDKDGINDVAAGSFDTNLYLFSGKDGKLIFKKKVSEQRILSVKVIPDTNNSGFDDIAVGTQKLHYGPQEGAGSVFVFEGNPALYQKGGKIDTTVDSIAAKTRSEVTARFKEHKIKENELIQLLSGAK